MCVRRIGVVLLMAWLTVIACRRVPVSESCSPIRMIADDVLEHVADGRYRFRLSLYNNSDQTQEVERLLASCNASIGRIQVLRRSGPIVAGEPLVRLEPGQEVLLEVGITPPPGKRPIGLQAQSPQGHLVGAVELHSNTPAVSCLARAVDLATVEIGTWVHFDNLVRWDVGDGGLIAVAGRSLHDVECKNVGVVEVGSNLFRVTGLVRCMVSRQFILPIELKWGRREVGRFTVQGRALASNHEKERCRQFNLGIVPRSTCMNKKIEVVAQEWEGIRPPKLLIQHRAYSVRGLQSARLDDSGECVWLSLNACEAGMLSASVWREGCDAALVTIEGVFK